YPARNSRCHGEHVRQGQRAMAVCRAHAVSKRYSGTGEQTWVLHQREPIVLGKVHLTTDHGRVTAGRRTSERHGIGDEETVVDALGAYHRFEYGHGQVMSVGD